MFRWRAVSQFQYFVHSQLQMLELDATAPNMCTVYTLRGTIWFERFFPRVAQYETYDSERLPTSIFIYKCIETFNVKTKYKHG